MVSDRRHLEGRQPKRPKKPQEYVHKGPPAAEREVKTPLQEALAELMSRRWLDDVTHRVLREPKEDSTPLREGHLNVHVHQLTAPQREMLHGKRPKKGGALRIEGDMRNLTGLVKMMDGTPEDEARMRTAYFESAGVPDPSREHADDTERDQGEAHR